MGRSGGTVVGLMAVVLYVAAVLAGFRSGSEAWVAFHVDLTFGLLLLAAIRARFARTEASRDWWFGFALFGWASLLLASGPFEQDSGTFRVTSPYRAVAFQSFVPFPWHQDDAPWPRPIQPPTEANMDANRLYSGRFIKIFRCSCVLGSATLGAPVVALLGSRGRSRRRDDLDPSEPRP